MSMLIRGVLVYPMNKSQNPHILRVTIETYRETFFLIYKSIMAGATEEISEGGNAGCWPLEVLCKIFPTRRHLPREGTIWSRI